MPHTTFPPIPYCLNPVILPKLSYSVNGLMGDRTVLVALKFPRHESNRNIHVQNVTKKNVGSRGMGVLPNKRRLDWNTECLQCYWQTNSRDEVLIKADVVKRSKHISIVNSYNEFIIWKRIKCYSLTNPNTYNDQLKELRTRSTTLCYLFNEYFEYTSLINS